MVAVVAVVAAVVVAVVAAVGLVVLLAMLLAISGPGKAGGISRRLINISWGKKRSPAT